MHWSEIIGRWPTAEEFAADVGVKGVTARQWRLRNSVPVAYWPAIIEAADKRGFTDINRDLLFDLAVNATRAA